MYAIILRLLLLGVIPLEVITLTQLQLGIAVEPMFITAVDPRKQFLLEMVQEALVNNKRQLLLELKQDKQHKELDLLLLEIKQDIQDKELIRLL